jgi:hypothetical protein
MHGTTQAQPDFLTVVNLNSVVPVGHPRRAIKRHVEALLKKLSPLFNGLSAQEGRTSIPPEQLLKARVLMRSIPRVASASSTTLKTPQPPSVLN